MTREKNESCAVSNNARRSVLKGALVGVVAGAVIPEKWQKPVIQSVVLPAHAQTSPTEPQPFSEVFDVPGEFTFTVPDGVEEITVEAWGGGASPQAGGGNGARSGGGGGGYARSVLGVTPGDSFSVVVAASMAPWVGTNPGSGFDSSFGPGTVVAPGGSTAPDQSTGGPGGTGGTGDITFSGGAGAARAAFPGPGGGGGGSATATGAGGNAIGATGGTGQGNGGDGGAAGGGNGTDGGSPGGGGGGRGGNVDDSGVGTSGAGAAGQVIVSWVA